MRSVLRLAAATLVIAWSLPALSQSQSQSEQAPQSTPSAQPQRSDSGKGTSLSIGRIREYCAEWSETDFSKLKDPFLAGYCLGLIQAFRDGVALGTASTLAFIQEDLKSGRKESRAAYNRWCHPTGVPNQFLVGAFMDWSSRHQKHWHLPYSVGFYEAFREEWPCKDDSVQVEMHPPAEAAPADNQK